MLEHLRLLNLVYRGAVSIAALIGIAGVVLAQPTRIVIDDTRVFSGEPDLDGGRDDHHWQHGPWHGLSRHIRCRESRALDCCWIQ
jgi:hypothetical protein